MATQPRISPVLGAVLLDTLGLTRQAVTMVVRDDGKGPGTTLRLGLPRSL